MALHTLPEKSALTNGSLWRSVPCPSERKQRSQHKLKIEKAMKCFTINTNDSKLDKFFWFDYFFWFDNLLLVADFFKYFEPLALF